MEINTIKRGNKRYGYFSQVPCYNHLTRKKNTIIKCYVVLSVCSTYTL